MLASAACVVRLCTAFVRHAIRAAQLRVLLLRVRYHFARAWSPGTGTDERRVVTVLFADLAGFTALGEQLDPEDVRDLQGELYEVLNTEVERFGGTTEKFAGDAILAVFGIPQTHEDDPERAVRAALAAHDRFTAFADRVRTGYRAEVGLRIGVNTGEVVAGREAAAGGELMVSGDAVNVAARLQQSAKPGEVLVGERTFAATNRAVSYGPRRDIDVKGKQAHVPCWAALSAQVEPALRTAGLTAPFIGRRRRSPSSTRSRRGSHARTSRSS